MSKTTFGKTRMEWINSAQDGKTLTRVGDKVGSVAQTSSTHPLPQSTAPLNFSFALSVCSRS